MLVTMSDKELQSPPSFSQLLKSACAVATQHHLALRTSGTATYEPFRESGAEGLAAANAASPATAG